MSGFEAVTVRELAGPRAKEAARQIGRQGAEAVRAALEAPEYLTVPAGRRALSLVSAGLPAPEVLPILFAALERKDWRPNQVACDALCVMGEAISSELTAQLRTSASGYARVLLILCLQRIGGPWAEAPLRKCARSDSEPQVRAAALQALGRLGASASAPEVMAGLSDPAPLVVDAAIRAAGCLRLPEAVARLQELLPSESAERRAALVYALERIGAPEGRPAILEALQDPDAYVRWSATVALRRLWAAACQAPLAERLQDPNATVAASARETLAACGTHSGPPLGLAQ